ncbi:DHS-like NAD/FAD-binding domain-containing protein [Lobosporangium transversale]|uniref:DHS-like NAD/FAD-binding domain-containing protein n=1 Tax=Lobosporangium transversale TaxID=64571 RepID=A0A1Y2GC36_9FUNG|nr:DHS-like NAD/FAD-binding domain-containing protein [Lobosporangium transversale]ORZ05348.1 DHS-like NAD/FAD-binding domain-containing protein [Lobosporangium transversale]|eukprot:XP_021877040.1 DHS-like NAD/FAD-binding domain-containing protein [Lobosporangium transversale]
MGKLTIVVQLSTGPQIELSDNLTERYLLGALSDRLKKLLRRRQKLQHVNTLEDVVSLLKSSKQIMVLTGAGVSVSCGIPDFRSEDGIYSRLSEFELDDPQQMFDLEFFRERPQIFYSFAREIFPSNFTPSPSHYFIKLLEDQGKLLRNYTQNIDTLEQKAGIQKVLECHAILHFDNWMSASHSYMLTFCFILLSGSFATASCVRCGHQVRGDEIKEHIFKQEVAYCKVCKTPTPPPKAKAKSKKRSKSGYHSSDEDSEESDGDDMNKPLMKPDIVFFGEKLPDVFHTSLKEDRGKADLLIVIGSSLKVAPVSDIMHQLPHSVPQILINRTPNHQTEFDVQLLGNCDTIVAELCRMAGWELKHERLPRGTSTVPDMDKYTNEDGSGAGGRAAWSFVEPNVYLFDGADPEELNFQAIQERYRRKPRGEIGGLISVGGHDSDVEDEEDEENDENEENDDSGSDSQAEGSEHASNDLEDMEGLTTEISKRRLTPSQPDRAGSTGLMDEDHVDLEQSSEHNQDITRTASANINTSASNHTVITPLEPLQSPSLQPAGLATGTTEPRSGSIQHIHDQHPEADSSRPLPALATIGTVALKDPIVHSDGDDEDDEDEEKKIRVMFAEKMPKDLGEDDDLGLSRIHSRRPSMDLMPITEDAQEVEVDDGSSDGGGHDSQAIEAERAN